MRSFPLASLLLFLFSVPASAGGPLDIRSDGAIYKWDVSSGPIHYRVDGGPLALNGGTVVVDHTAGVNRVEAMFAAWHGVSTTALEFQDDGGLQSFGALTDGDVNTLDELSAVLQSCANSTQSPVIFDAGGGMLKSLGLPPDIIGVAGPCSESNDLITSGFVFMNGAFQDGVNTSTNEELTAAQFDEAIIHEIGHFLDLGHSQVNVNVLSATHDQCTVDDRAGLPLMFPFAHCQARSAAGLPVISPDDAAWISFLYPNASFSSTYGSVEGQIYFADGITPVQGVNIVARAIDDPATPGIDESKRNAISVVSGFLFADLYDSALGSPYGSKEPIHEGYFKMPLPAGTWSLSFESVNPNFVFGSRVGSLEIPIKAPGSAGPIPITITPGNSQTIDVNLNTTAPRFDRYEDESWMDLPDPALAAEESETA
jgi:hypothetical protein